LTLEQHQRQHCPFVKGRYFCSSESHRLWLDSANLPYNASEVDYGNDINTLRNLYIVWVGNSHLRQISESLLCAIQTKIDRIHTKYHSDRKALIKDDLAFFRSSELNLNITTLFNEGTMNVGNWTDDEWNKWNQFLEDHKAPSIENAHIFIVGDFNSPLVTFSKVLQKIMSIPFTGTMIYAGPFHHGKWFKEVRKVVPVEQLDIIDRGAPEGKYGPCGADEIPIGMCSKRNKVMLHSCIPGPSNLVIEDVLNVIKRRKKLGILQRDT